MEENISWKIVYLATTFSLLVLGIAYYLIAPHDNTFFSEEKINKIAQFSQTRIEGRKEGKRSWEFLASQGWTDKQEQITYLKNVKNGLVFNRDEKLTVKQLVAPLIKIHRKADLIEALGKPPGSKGKSTLTALVDMGKMSQGNDQKADWARLQADRIAFFPNEKRAEFAGQVKLFKKKNTILANRIDLDSDHKIARLSGEVIVVRQNGLVTAGQGEYFGDQEQLNITDKVALSLQENKIKSIINCHQATIYNDTQKDISFNGQVIAQQGKKLARGNTGIYSSQKKTLLLEGQTETILEKGADILNKQAVTHLDNPDVKELLKNKTVVLADKITFSTKTGDAKAVGNVFVTQKGKEAKATTADYNDNNETLTLTGNVFLKRGQDWLECREVIISINKETFEALGVNQSKLSF